MARFSPESFVDLRVYVDPRLPPDEVMVGIGDDGVAEVTVPNLDADTRAWLMEEYGDGKGLTLAVHRLRQEGG